MQIEPNTEVRLLKGVPLNLSYENIINWENEGHRDYYFANSFTNKFIEHFKYVREGAIKVPYCKDDLFGYNYMSYKNKLYGNRIFYAFITNITYINPHTSLVEFTIDVWNTWKFDISFNKCYIERKHCRRWNSDGTPVINTVPEDLNYGSEYQVVGHAEYANRLYWVVFVATLDISLIPTINGVPNPLNLFYAPIYLDISHCYRKGKLIKGGNTYDLTNIDTILSTFRTNQTLVNNLVSCYISDEAPFEYTYSLDTSTGDITINSNDVSHVSLEGLSLMVSSHQGRPKYTDREFEKYTPLKRSKITESKLLMYPYSFVQLIDGQGNNMIVKNEYVRSIHLNIRTLTSMGLSNKQAHYVKYYNHDQALVPLANCRWELQNGIISSSANNITIVDDYSAAYLQGNANQIQQSITNAQNTAQTNSAITKNNNLARKGFGMAGAFQSVINAGIAGLAGSAIGTTSAMAEAGATGATGMVGGLGGIGKAETQNVLASSNTFLQNKLNTTMAIENANAKVEDAKEVADNVSLQSGDVFFTYQNLFNGYCLVYKQISDEYIDILQDYFKRYGYKVNRFETPQLNTRQSFDYIKMLDCQVKGNVDTNVIELIKKIFETGVTIWHHTDVGNYDIPNNEL